MIEIIRNGSNACDATGITVTAANMKKAMATCRPENSKASDRETANTDSVCTVPSVSRSACAPDVAWTG
jgi:hypothetical protein